MAPPRLQDEDEQTVTFTPRLNRAPRIGSRHARAGAHCRLHNTGICGIAAATSNALRVAAEAFKNDADTVRNCA